MSLEERVARIEGILGQMDKRLAEFREDFTRRLNHLETEIAGLRDEFRAEIAGLRDEFRAEIAGLRSEMGSLFRWTIGLIIGVWATVITLMLPILLRLLGVI
jgi:hypothetical protein